VKKCSKCNLSKALEEFYIDRRNKKYGRSSRCKVCATAGSKLWYQNSDKYKNIVRNSGLKRRYGINPDFYYQLLEEQDYVCAICKTKGNQRFLHLDHDHVTGAIRGLLCKTCNHGLGNFKDNKVYLNNAIKYLDRKTVSEF
jgi:hypothetical protein